MDNRKKSIVIIDDDERDILTMNQLIIDINNVQRIIKDEINNKSYTEKFALLDGAEIHPTVILAAFCALSYDFLLLQKGFCESPGAVKVGALISNTFCLTGLLCNLLSALDFYDQPMNTLQSSHIAVEHLLQFMRDLKIMEQIPDLQNTKWNDISIKNFIDKTTCLRECLEITIAEIQKKHAEEKEQYAAVNKQMDSEAEPKSNALSNFLSTGLMGLFAVANYVSPHVDIQNHHRTGSSNHTKRHSF